MVVAVVCKLTPMHYCWQQLVRSRFSMSVTFQEESVDVTTSSSDAPQTRATLNTAGYDAVMELVQAQLHHRDAKRSEEAVSPSCGKPWSSQTFDSRSSVLVCVARASVERQLLLLALAAEDCWFTPQQVRNTVRACFGTHRQHTTAALAM